MHPFYGNVNYYRMLQVLRKISSIGAVATMKCIPPLFSPQNADLNRLPPPALTGCHQNPDMNPCYAPQSCHHNWADWKKRSLMSYPGFLLLHDRLHGSVWWVLWLEMKSNKSSCLPLGVFKTLWSLFVQWITDCEIKFFIASTANVNRVPRFYSSIGKRNGRPGDIWTIQILIDRMLRHWKYWHWYHWNVIIRSIRYQVKVLTLHETTTKICAMFWNFKNFIRIPGYSVVKIMPYGIAKLRYEELRERRWVTKKLLICLPISSGITLWINAWPRASRFFPRLFLFLSYLFGDDLAVGGHECGTIYADTFANLK